MFTLHPHAARRSMAEARPTDLHDDQSGHGPLDGELLDLYVAILIVVPVALALKAFLY
jgi:hypothetical protein